MLSGYDKNGIDLIYFPVTGSFLEKQDVYNRLSTTTFREAVPTAGNRFGFSTVFSRDGSTMAVGVPGASTYTGKVYIYNYSQSGGWEIVQTLNPTLTRLTGQWFGYSIAFSDDASVLAIGAPGLNGSSNTNALGYGALYIYSKTPSGYSLDSTIKGVDITINGNASAFSQSIDINSIGDTIVLGARLLDWGGDINRGKVYVFKKINNIWGLHSELTETNGNAYHNFGTKVLISRDGEYIFVSTPLDDSIIPGYRGNLTIFKLTNGIYQSIYKITPSIISTNSAFGHSMALSFDSNILVVGAHFNDTKGSNSGCVCIFSKDVSSGTWMNTQVIYAPDAAASDFFGKPVSISDDGNFIFICSSGDDDFGSESGSVYIYERKGVNYYYKEKIYAPTPVQQTKFGEALNVLVTDSGFKLLVGSPLDDNGGATTNESGAFYLFDYEVGKSDYDYINEFDVLDKNLYVYKDFLPIKLTNELMATTNEYGFSVSISDDGKLAVVGAPNAPYGLYTNVGRAFVYTKDASGNWNYKTELNPSPVSGVSYSNINFGYSTSIAGDCNCIVVGCPKDVNTLGQPIGSIYIYSYNATADTFDLLARRGANLTNQQLNAYMGKVVDIDYTADTIIAGTPEQTVSTLLRVGCVFVNERVGVSSTFNQTMVTPSDPQTGAVFGSDVSISSDGTRFIAGSPNKTVGANVNQGKCYIFSKSGTAWIQEAGLTASDGAANDLFGFSCDMSGDGNTVVVGAYGDDTSTGSVYIFTRSGSAWTQQAKLTAGDKATGDSFGCDVGICYDGNKIIVGSYKDGGGSPAEGAAYIFTRSGSAWTQIEKQRIVDQTTGTSYTNVNIKPAGNFGYSVWITKDGNSYIVGAPALNTNTGAAYIYPSFDRQNLRGVYTGFSDEVDSNIKYFASKGKFIYKQNHGYAVGQPVYNNTGIKIGFALEDRIFIDY